MTRLVWGETSKKYYETGTDRGVLYLQNATGGSENGVAWPGLTGVKQSPDGGEETKLYADNQAYISLYSVENFKGTISAYMYPREFNACEGNTKIVDGVYAAQQTHQPFGFTYRTLVGNDTQQTKAGYKIHILYNCMASPSDRDFKTVNDKPDAVEFSWDISTTPATPKSSAIQPTAHLIIDSTQTNAAKLKSLEDLLYGTDSKPATLPTIDEVFALFTPSSAG